MEWEKGQAATPPPRRRKGLFSFFLATLLVVLVVGSALYTYRLFRPTPAPKEGPARPARENFLLLGIDRGEQGYRSDTIILVSVDLPAKKLKVLSIPRDTQVTLPGHRGWHKLNAAYALGGPELAVRAVEELVGVPIDHYALTSFEGFARAIDLLGGVVVDVEKPMHYDDFAGNLHIHLEPGRQLLNGWEALGYVRYRGDGWGDITAVDPTAGQYEGRITRQQKFLRAVVDQLLQPGVIFRLPRLLAELSRSVRTDLTPGEMLRYALALRELKEMSVEAEVVPGSGQVIDGVSYWVPDRPALAQVVARLFGRGSEPAAPGGLTAAAPSAAAGAEPVREAEGPKVEVLNGCGVQGLAARAAQALSREGFQVVRTGNAQRSDYGRSQIIIRTERPVYLEKLSALIRDPAFSWELDPASDVDLTIILSAQSGF
ncbi:MAG: LCP family protein [Bacillota bacterium]|nr:LCP family protein [Bacillota bacterium]